MSATANGGGDAGEGAENGHRPGQCEGGSCSAVVAEVTAEVATAEEEEAVAIVVDSSPWLPRFVQKGNAHVAAALRSLSNGSSSKSGGSGGGSNASGSIGGGGGGSGGGGWRETCSSLQLTASRLRLPRSSPTSRSASSRSPSKSPSSKSPAAKSPSKPATRSPLSSSPGAGAGVQGGDSYSGAASSAPLRPSSPNNLYCYSTMWGGPPDVTVVPTACQSQFFGVHAPPPPPVEAPPPPPPPQLGVASCGGPVHQTGASAARGGGSVVIPPPASSPASAAPAPAPVASAWYKGKPVEYDPEVG